MSTTNLQTWWWDGVLKGAEFGLNWTVQSTLLLGIGFGVAWLLRGRGSAVQSAVYRTTLVAVLICPLITWILAQSGVSGYSLALPDAWVLRGASEVSVVADKGPASGTRTTTAADSAVAFSPPSSEMIASLTRSERSPASDATLASCDDLPRTTSSGQESSTTPSTKNRPTLAAQQFGLVAAVIFSVWLVGAGILLARIAGAWRQLWRIRDSAVEAELATLATCREVASLMKLAAPEVKHSPYLPSPCLAGLQRPVVLLPESLQAMSVRDVLIHELAHLRRRDCHWSLLARLAAAVFFFQPLLWRLLRRLEGTAEEVCDDYVVQLGGDRQEYAHRLVDLAALSTTPVAAAAVGIVSVKSMLARRVVRITDSSRRLSTRAGRLVFVSVIAGGLLTTLTTALVGFELAAAGSDTRANEDAVSNVKAASEDGSSANFNEATVRGRIVDGDGKPVARAHVAAVATSLLVRPGSDFTPQGEVLAETVTDAQGRYALGLPKVTAKGYQSPRVIARIDGKGIAWQELDLTETDVEASLTLPQEELLRGKLVDSDGQPASGVRLSTRLVQPTGVDTGPAAVGYDFGTPPAAWLPPVESDDRGQFAVRGIPRGHGVLLRFAGNDRFAPQGFELNTGAPEQRGKYDQTYRSPVKNLKPGEEALLTMAPAPFFEGVVRYEDTGQPAAHARLTVWASQQEKFGSMTGVAGEADAEGRYRISPEPGVRFQIIAYPPNGEPYLARKVDDLKWEAAKPVDIALPRGVLVRGSVKDSSNNVPVKNASIQYNSEEGNNPHATDDILTGWQAIQVSNEQGEFEIAVCPGPGNLIVRGPTNDYVLHQSSTGELHKGRVEGLRVYAHGIQHIDPKVGTAPVEVSVSLVPSSKVTGELVDDQGLPVDDALMISRLNTGSLSLSWQSNPQPCSGGRFEIAGLSPGEKCPVHFLAPKRQLGATVLVEAGADPMRVVLKPCGRAVMRFIDSEGKPVADFDSHEFTDEMIVTPGVSKFAPYESTVGRLREDAELISNVDRENHWGSHKSDGQGRFTLPALIPGATYSVAVGRDGKPVVVDTFQVEAGETHDLGDIVVDRPE